MVLRASAEASGEKLQLAGVVDVTVSTGIAAGDALVAFADAVLGADEALLGRAREALDVAVGRDGVVAAAQIAGNFSRNDRIANATGIALEKDFVTQSEDFREALGINQYRSAVNTLG